MLRTFGVTRKQRAGERLRCLNWHLRELSITHLGSMPSPHHLLRLAPSPKPPTSPCPRPARPVSGNGALMMRLLGETVCVLTTTPEGWGLSSVIEGLPNH